MKSKLFATIAEWWNPYRKIPAVREAIRIQPGDYVAVLPEEPMDDQTAHRLSDMLKDVWPDVRCVIFEPCTRIEVLRADDGDEEPHETSPRFL